MSKRRAVVPLVLLMLLAAIPLAPAAAEQVWRTPRPADPLAGGHAASLHRNLVAAGDPDRMPGFIFGQQHALWESKRYRFADDMAVDWGARKIATGAFDGFVSDIELATTLLPGVDPHAPAVLGFNLQTALNLDPAMRVTYAGQIVSAFASGGIVTVHFPAGNPVTGGDHKDLSGNALCLLSTDWRNPHPAAAEAVAAWQDQLASAAEFVSLVNSLWRDPDRDGGNERSGRVAFVFRPFHEMLQVRHWWSGAFFDRDPAVCDRSAAAAYRSLWRQTFDFMTGADDPMTPGVEGLDVHGMLFAWSPDRPAETEGWEAFYPNAGLDPAGGRDYVDVIAFDVYEHDPTAFGERLVADVAAVTAFNASLPAAAAEVVAIGEFGPAFGLSNVADANWFMQEMLRPLADAGFADQIAYAMTWSNFDEDYYWVPLPCYNLPTCASFAGGTEFYGARFDTTGDPLRGFRAFVNHPATMFLEDLPAWWWRPDPTIPYEPGEGLLPRLPYPCWSLSDVVGSAPQLETCHFSPTAGSLGLRLGR